MALSFIGLLQGLAINFALQSEEANFLGFRGRQLQKHTRGSIGLRYLSRVFHDLFQSREIFEITPASRRRDTRDRLRSVAIMSFHDLHNFFCSRALADGGSDSRRSRNRVA